MHTAAEAAEIERRVAVQRKTKYCNCCTLFAAAAAAAAAAASFYKADTTLLLNTWYEAGLFFYRQGAGCRATQTTPARCQSRDRSAVVVFGVGCFGGRS